jgi:hypothetical protein
MRAYAARQSGYALQMNIHGKNGYPPRDRLPKPPATVYLDPTTLRGPEHVKVVPGASKTVRYSIDARDEFFTSRRARLTVECDHPDMTEKTLRLAPPTTVAYE